ncbi:MAG: hypothetical protein KY468_03435 [Armatimonadetes bacterium]|nr:hypothetical protein [Armatimonadota bacterium]
MEHATPFMAVVLLVLSGIILYNILTARGGRDLFIRRIPGLAAIDEAVGRATEMGRPLLFSPGLFGLGVETLQALSVLGHIIRLAARYNSRVIVPVCDAQVYPIAEEVAREAYNQEGRPELYNADDIRFLSDRQFAYASGTVGIMNREKVAANFFFGGFFAEALILAEAGREVGAIQVAGTPSTTQIPFLIAACDYTIIGEEYYAASAYLTRDPVLLGSLVGQDWSKVALLLLIFFGAILASLGLLTVLHWIQIQLGMPAGALV